MKPVYWIGIMAVIGAVVTYAIFRDSGIGAAVGILVGTIIYAQMKEKS